MTQAEINAVLGSAVESIVTSIRASCTVPSEVAVKGGDLIVYAVADWVENPPEWVKATWADEARRLHGAREQATAAN